uniref:Uncharacterized protein n=1 Tax=Pseudictyota dubia TaxID=2749911 RepID=A0A7R9W3C7_9STRA|mmetsp:Transcript_31406/g.57922  ORF Transcript_31406/g.57922 Transcript_31406/m.57922 type:complete len:156 (+) Transcript_31406:110-577(+)
MRNIRGLICALLFVALSFISHLPLSCAFVHTTHSNAIKFVKSSVVSFGSTPNPIKTKSGGPSPTALLEKSDDVDRDAIMGMNTGPYLFALVLALNIWSFSIPVEFRRARFCSEQQVLNARPGNKCITFGNWVGGIADYYRNGGGIHFDFSIEEQE